MRRIGLAVALVLGVLAPLSAEGQRSDKVPRIGYPVLSPLVDPPSPERAAFLDGLRELGWVEQDDRHRLPFGEVESRVVR